MAASMAFSSSVCRLRDSPLQLLQPNSSKRLSCQRVPGSNNEKSFTRLHTVARASPGMETIKVIVNGAAGKMGREAIRAVTKSRGMEVFGAVDKVHVGEDAGELAGLEEPLEVMTTACLECKPEYPEKKEIPVINDLVMVLGSLAQTKQSAVLVDFTEPDAVFDTVRQSVAFGVRPVVGTRDVDPGLIADLADFCERSSVGCVFAPNLSIGLALLQQATTSAAFYYNAMEIIESSNDPSADVPSILAFQTSSMVSGMGRQFNPASAKAANANAPACGELVGDGIRVHSLRQPGLLYSQEVRLGGAGETYSLRHDAYDYSAYTAGLLLCIRKVVRMKSLVFGIEKLLT
eukprot:jgi/Mesvir1/26672/Mv20456-RA.1